MPLTKDFKATLEKAIKKECYNRCFRCDGLTNRKKESHLVQDCPAIFADCWNEGKGKLVIDTDRSEAEQLYWSILAQAHPSKAGRNQAPPSAPTPTGLKNAAGGQTGNTTSLGNQAASSNRDQSTPISSKDKQQPVKLTASAQPVKEAPRDQTQSCSTERTPKPDPLLGKTELKPDKTPPRNELEPAQDGVLSLLATTQLGPAANGRRGEMKIISNYVKVNRMPKRLHVYSLAFSHSTPGSTTNARTEVGKRWEIKAAFDALNKVDAFDVKKNGQAWASDYKTLWTTWPLPHCPPDQGVVHVTNPVPFTCLNGLRVSDLQATVTFSQTLDDIDQAFKDKGIADLSDHIRALNALVAKRVDEMAPDKNYLTHVGANKFYINGGYQDMAGLRAVRGYFTSIRRGNRGTLLNINTTTSPFIQPILVSELLYQVFNLIRPASMNAFDASKAAEDYVQGILKGATLRIIYRRKNYEESDMDKNCEEARLKPFIQFGLDARKQKFFKLKPRDKKNPKAQRQWDKDSDPDGTTVFDYFREDCKVTVLQHYGADFVCVNVGKMVDMRNDTMQKQTEKGAIWIPARLLQIEPFQLARGTLHPAHISKMIGYALRLPRPNAEMITTEGFKCLGLANQSIGANQVNNGFELGRNLIALSAKTLEAPDVFYHPQQSAVANTVPSLSRRVDRIRASWDLRQVSFAKATSFENLHVMGLGNCFHLHQKKRKTEKSELKEKEEMEKKLIKLGQEFEKALHGHGVSANLDCCELSDDLGIPQAMRNWFRCCEMEDCSLILLEREDSDKYAIIKRIADLQYGSHNLCAVASKIKETGNRRDQHFSNLALKVNMKRGGAGHYLDENKLNERLGGRRTDMIILGADVTHPGPNTKLGSPSIACVVGSVDEYFMNYPGSMRLQAGGQEQIEDMCSMVKERIEAWQKNNEKKNKKIGGKARLPGSILFYRDGISESQFDSCRSYEIKQIRKAYRELQGDADRLQITFVVVGKRHNTRFYPTDESQTYKDKEKIMDKKTGESTDRIFLNGNLKPGLLVDDVVTSPDPDTPDFFLQSHCAIKGTARPAHYHVLEDGMKLWPTQLPRLTYMLCHAFGRATKGVSYVAPAYIADRLCERGRSYLRMWHKHGSAFPKPTREDGKPLNKSEMLIWKKERALEIARGATFKYHPEDRYPEWVWGQYNDDPGQDAIRLNPWHPNLDEGMFWM